MSCSQRYLPTNLLQCTQCGIAPAMKLEGENTYWCMHVEQGEDRKLKELLGVDLSLKTPGADAEKTQRKQAAVAIIEDPERGMENARQTMLRLKQGYGTGIDLQFPSEAEVEEAMQGLLFKGVRGWQPHDTNHMVGSTRRNRCLGAGLEQLRRKRRA